MLDEQIGLLTLLKEFDSICKKNNITYYLEGGSLLGAVRHKGFLPWDDDVDLFITRAEWQKLLKVIDKDLPEGQIGNIYISVRLYDSREVSVEISDNGCGIEDVARAREPMFTTGEYGDRCGMGFLVMESFTDFLSVKSRLGKGTTVLMRKKLKP